MDGLMGFRRGTLTPQRNTRLPAQSRTGATELRTLGGRFRCRGGATAGVAATVSGRGRSRTCCLRHVKAALCPDELQAVRAPGRTRTFTTGSVIRHDLLFTTGAWYPRQEMSLRPP